MTLTTLRIGLFTSLLSVLSHSTRHTMNTWQILAEFTTHYSLLLDFSLVLLTFRAWVEYWANSLISSLPGEMHIETTPERWGSKVLKSSVGPHRYPLLGFPRKRCVCVYKEKTKSDLWPRQGTQAAHISSWNHCRQSLMLFTSLLFKHKSLQYSPPSQPFCGSSEFYILRVVGSTGILLMKIPELLFFQAYNHVLSQQTFLEHCWSVRHSACVRDKKRSEICT